MIDQRYGALVGLLGPTFQGDLLHEKALELMGLFTSAEEIRSIPDVPILSILGGKYILMFDSGFGDLHCLHRVGQTSSRIVRVAQVDRSDFVDKFRPSPAPEGLYVSPNKRFRVEFVTDIGDREPGFQINMNWDFIGLATVKEITRFYISMMIAKPIE